MKIIILQGSPNKKGSTSILAESFAKGAVEAAKFLAGKPAGLYDMADVVG